MELKQKTNSVAFSLKANYTNRAVGEVTANFCGERGVAWSAQRIPTASNLGFLHRSRYFFIQVTP
jgi:hypothetical protein